MKKLLRDRGLAERGGSLRKGGGGFPNCFIIFLSFYFLLENDIL